jgi:HK97 family phage prohead protease
MIRFTPTHQITIDAAADETAPRRSFSGIAVEYDIPAIVSDGTAVMFKKGSLPIDGRKPKLYLQHQSDQIIGQVVERTEVDNAMLFVAKVSQTRLGDEAMTLIADGTLSEVSVGVQVEKFSYNDEGVMIIEKASWQELSVVSQPAFESSVITQIAASNDESIPQTEPETDVVSEPSQEKDENPMSETKENLTVEASEKVDKLWASARKETKLPTAAEYISAFCVGGDKFQAMRETIRAAAPDVITTDIPGILPLPIVQPTYSNFQGRRPVVDAVGARAMPQSGKVFIRPKVTTHTSISAQASENASLDDGTFVVTDEQVTKGTFGGYVTLSEQSIDWSTPEVIGLVLDDMARIYANATDNKAADDLKTGATVTAAFGNDATDPTQWNAFISGAAQTILSGSNGNLPTHLFVSPNMWGYLLGLNDTADRPLFPQIGPMNAFGNLAPGQVNGVAFGLQVVVDRNFATDTVIVGDASGYEIFEQQKGAISIDVPSTLSRTLAFRGYFATLMIDATKFVKATF